MNTELITRGANITRGGVCYDLKSSPYTYQIPYKDKGTIVYYFSSKTYREKFIETTLKARERIDSAINQRLGVNVNTEILADLVNYNTIEKKGFHCTLMGVNYSCLSNINLDMTIK